MNHDLKTLLHELPWGKSLLSQCFILYLEGEVVSFFFFFFEQYFIQLSQKYSKNIPLRFCDPQMVMYLFCCKY